MSSFILFSFLKSSIYFTLVLLVHSQWFLTPYVFLPHFNIIANWIWRLHNISNTMCGSWNFGVIFEGGFFFGFFFPRNAFRFEKLFNSVLVMPLYILHNENLLTWLSGDIVDGTRYNWTMCKAHTRGSDYWYLNSSVIVPPPHTC